MSPMVLECLALLMRPLMRYCLRHGLKAQAFIEVCKAEFVAAAGAELKKRGEEITASRISIMTGLQRRDVTRLSKGPRAELAQSLTSKVVGLWMTSKRYLSSDGSPRDLSIDEFYGMVSSVSKDLNPSTVLAELQRVGSAKLEGQTVKAISNSYIPVGDLKAGFAIASQDLSDLIDAVNENLSGVQSKELPHHHLRTEFDRIRPEALTEIRKWLLSQGKEFHMRARSYLSQFDQDINPDVAFKGTGRRVSISSFAKCDSLENEI